MNFKNQFTRREALTGAASLMLAVASSDKGAISAQGTAAQGAVPGATQGGAQIEHLGQPCRARNVHTGLVVEDAGREWFVITNTNEAAHVELIFIDPATDTAQVYRAPAGAGAWALHPLPQNRLALGTYYDGMFLIFDVPRREWIKSIKFPGEQYIWSLALGSDGRLYGGTYPGGKLGAIDPSTFAFEDFGAPSKAKNNMYLRYTSALPDGRIFCQFGYANPETMIFDPQTKRFAAAPPSLQSAAQGVVWNGYFMVGNKAYQMPDLTEVNPLPFPLPNPEQGDWSIDMRLTDAENLVIRQGLAVLHYRADKAADKVADKPALRPLFTLTPRSAVSLMARNKENVVYGVRGQDYFAIPPGQTALELKLIPGEAVPRATHFLRIDDAGLLWGGPSFGQTLFYLDTKTRQVTNTRTVSDHGGEVYDAVIINGLCYAVAYVGGEIIRFDPKAPWDQIHQKNPRTIARVGPDYIRPSAGVILGSDGRLYSGWLAKYGAYGGALSQTDPNTGATEIFKDPLGPHGLEGLAQVGTGLFLMGTTTYGNGLGYQKDVPVKLGLWSLTEKKPLAVHEFTGVTAINNIVYDSKTNRAAFLLGGKKLHLYDVAQRTLALEGAPLASDVNGGCIAWQAGQFLYGSGDSLKALDAATGTSQVIAKLPGRIEKITCGGPEKLIYVACGIDVYRVRI